MKSIAILVGHGESQSGKYDPGATSRGYEEFKIAKEIAKYVYNMLEEYECKCKLVNYEGDLNLQERINLFRNDKETNLIVEIHINAGGGSGCEVYYYNGDKVGKDLASQISQNISKALNIRDRGAKEGNQFGIIRETKLRALLVECCFIDSNDLFLVDTKPEQKLVGERIGQTLIDYFRLQKDSEILYFVQIGAFKDRSNAERMLEKARKAGFADAFIKILK